MRILVTGSAGHLGEGLVRHLEGSPHDVIGLDLQSTPFTHQAGSIEDAGLVDDLVCGVDAIIHTATLHKPHVATHSRQAFVDTNISGTLHLLEAAVRHHVRAFVFTSTTSTFGDAMRPADDGPAVWVTEDLVARPKNIYGVTKLAAENLCRMFHRNLGLPTVVLRTSRFFLEDDDNRHKRDAFDNDNLKVNELAFRRADLHDMVTAHVCALENAPQLGGDTLVVTATPAFTREDLSELAVDAPAVLARHQPSFPAIYREKGWSMFQSIGRVYDNTLARQKLGWVPEYGFGQALDAIQAGRDYRSPLAVAVGCKPYHDHRFDDGPFPVEETPEITPGHDR